MLHCVDTEMSTAKSRKLSKALMAFHDRVLEALVMIKSAVIMTSAHLHFHMFVTDDVGKVRFLIIQPCQCISNVIRNKHRMVCLYGQ